MPEVIVDGETGFVVSVEDYPRQAAEALERVKTIDPHACRRRVEERFSKESMVAGYERAYDLAVSGG